MRAILIHNPTAGTGDHTPEHLTSILNEAGYSDVAYCSKKDERYKKMLLSPADLVLIAGGDGTIAKVIRCQQRNDVPIAILPLGTANNIARAIGLHTAPELLLECLKGHKTRGFDVGIIKGPWGERRFIEAVGFGSLAELMGPGPKPPAAERTKIGRQMLKQAVADARIQQLTLDADGETLVLEALITEILNTRYIGPGLPFGPHSEVGDGLLDLVYLPPERRAEMVTWIDNPERSPPFLLRQARKITLQWEGRTLHVDDQAYPHPGVVTELEIGIIRKGVRFCVPTTRTD
jgi:diacylglycerol kinase (ATP)